MRLRHQAAEIFVPDGANVREAISRCTHMGIGAHQDDLEILAYQGILSCFGNSENWFFGITVTDGAGSPRGGIYADCSDQDIRGIRKKEQKKAAIIGEYGGIAFLEYPSLVLKDTANNDVREDIKTLISAGRPSVIYTHTPADKHDTHVAVALRTIQALRELSGEYVPEKVYGCEVWRSLDWLVDNDKAILEVSGRDNLASSLLGTFDSQISHGKRYDLAAIGRRQANATFNEIRQSDSSTGLIFAMDLTPLVTDRTLEIESYLLGFVDRFGDDVARTIRRLI